MREHTRVVVLGAGPSGSAAAAELARRGWPTLLVGRSCDRRPNIGECLPPGIRPMLEKAGVWEAFLRAGHTVSVGIRSSWGSHELADRDFLLSPYGAGWHIDRTRFDAMMRDSALCNGAEGLECLALRDVKPTAEGWRIKLSTDSGDHSVDSSFIIDATGRACVFARRVGAQRIAMDRLVGAAGYFSFGATSSLMEPMLLLEAVENGWWYTAPLPEGKLIAVFLTDADSIQREKLTQPDRWMAQLASTVEQSQRIQKHGLALDGEIRIVQAESSFLDRVAGDGWLAAGDAAASFDPLSAQGIMSAISSGLDAAHAAAARLSGDRKALVAYADRVRRSYAEYLTHRSVYYRIERRWLNGEFWKTRHALPPVFSRRGTSACA
ncbi:MAG: FAD-dependent monooxygenase [Candidatus Sulfotelmatobacter sp.]